MKKSLIRLLTLLLCFVMVFALAACGGNGGGTVDDGGGGGNETPDDGGDETPDDGGSTLPEKVSGELNVYISLNEDEVAAYETVAAEYMAMQSEKGNQVIVNINNNTNADSYRQSVEGLISMGVDEAALVKTGSDSS